MSNKCPHLIRKTSGQYYSGIICKSIGCNKIVGDNSPINNFQGWSEDWRNEFYNQFCIGDFKICKYFTIIS